MRIKGRRSAISQSMDLFIIIAAVLGVGGVVSASVYNLVNSATNNASIAVVGASVVGGYSEGGAASLPSAIAITVKNNGGSPVTCSSTSACTIVFAGTGISATLTCAPTTCLTSSPVAGPSSWAIGSGTAGPLLFGVGGTGFSLAPGAQTSLIASGITGGGTLTGMPAHGASVTLNIVFGSASTQVTVVAQ